MRTLHLAAGLALCGLLGLAQTAVAADDGVVSITLPGDHYSYQPGPNVEEAQGYCAACHAPDYVYMQPPLSRAQWHGEVLKMQKTYGCPVPDQTVDAIVDYLMSQNGRKG